MARVALSTSTLVILCAAILSLSAWRPSESKDLASCSEEQLDRHGHVMDAQQGIDGYDPRPDVLGDYHARQRLRFLPDPKHHWRPIDVNQKHAVCGLLYDNNFFQSLFTHEERDWNHFIWINTDDDPFYYMLNAPPDQDLAPCQRKDIKYDKCLEVEITPPFRLAEHVIVEMPTQRLPAMCAYGPWVGDHGHSGGKPEIHPSELLWWSEELEGTQLRHIKLMVMQDASRRFHSRERFDPRPPEGWRPWAEGPLQATFDIAFISDPAQPLPAFAVDDVLAEGVTTRDLPGAADNPMSRSVVFSRDGVPLVQVNEQQSADDDLRVSVSEVCTRPDGTHQGYVRLETQVGEVGREPSFQYLEVFEGRVAPEVVEQATVDFGTSPLSRPRSSFSVLPSTLRTTRDSDGGVSLVGDVAVASDPPFRSATVANVGWRTPSGDSTSTNAQIFGRTPELAATLSGVSVFSSGEFFVAAEGRELVTTKESVALLSTVFVDTILPGAPDPDALGDFLAIAGVPAERSEIPLPDGITLHAIREASGQATVSYAGASVGSPRGEDDSRLADALNQALIALTTQAPGQPFDVPDPIQVDLTGSYSDATGTTTELQQGLSLLTHDFRPYGQAWIAELEGVAVGNVRLRVDAADLYGNSAADSVDVPTHGLLVAPGSALLTYMSQVLDVSYDDLSVDLSAPTTTIRQPPHVMARVLETALSRATADGVVSLIEFAELLDGLRAWRHVRYGGNPARVS